MSALLNCQPGQDEDTQSNQDQAILIFAYTTTFDTVQPMQQVTTVDDTGNSVNDQHSSGLQATGTDVNQQHRLQTGLHATGIDADQRRHLLKGFRQITACKTVYTMVYKQRQSHQQLIQFQPARLLGDCRP